jgi:hypothetical protein
MAPEDAAAQPITQRSDERMQLPECVCASMYTAHNPLSCACWCHEGRESLSQPGSVGASSGHVGGATAAPTEPRGARNTPRTRLEPVDGRTDEARDRLAGESAPTADDSFAGSNSVAPQPAHARLLALLEKIMGGEPPGGE